MKDYYLTTAIPYVNAPPHIGHAFEFVLRDAIARYHALSGKNVLFLTGSDENALKNVQAAEGADMDVGAFVSTNADRFEKLIQALNVRVDVFQRGSNQKTHFPSSQKLWYLCAKNGDIYQKEYTGLYCVGCETFYEKDELDEHGQCLEHPGKKLEEVSEKNYFFNLSKYQDQIVKLITSGSLKITPDSKKNEILSFLKEPLHDISISRSNKRAKDWGVPVPGDPSQRIYVWFDALNIYQSGIGFGWDDKKYSRWWPASVHVIGKGINRFHTVYWPAFLLSAGLELPKEVFVHGYITIEGKKMSKSVGNVVDPFDLIEKYGTDALRYYLLREIPSHGDGDFSTRRFTELYNADLANGLGNLVARVAKLCEKHSVSNPNDNSTHVPYADKQGKYHNHCRSYEFNLALEEVWRDIRDLDGVINREEPWNLTQSQAVGTLKNYATTIVNIAFALQPFLPDTASRIIEQFTGSIQAEQPLFPRID